MTEAPESEPGEQPVQATPTEIAGQEGQPAETLPAATPTPSVESWLGEAEWPAQMRMGDSDTVRLKLLADQQGYTVTIDFPEHASRLEPLTIRRPDGYELTAVARLQGINFEISPQEEQSYTPLPGEPVEWMWTIQPKAAGQQRLSLSAVFEWRPVQGSSERAARQSVVYNHGLDVQVQPRPGGAMLLMAGAAGLLLIAALLAAPRLLRSRRKAPPVIRSPQPNVNLQVETPPELQLSPEERLLLQALFPRFSRLIVEEEFLSGYSGARTLLVLPIQTDGRRAARVIVKLGSRASIQTEYQNYQVYVKDSLPPLTARIKSEPVGSKGSRLAALPYTFIATPGIRPISLRQALLENPEPDYLYRLFDVFGPGWWMQRHPYTFRFGYEYDRMLSSHLTLAPSDGAAGRLDGRLPPEKLQVEPGENLQLDHFSLVEVRPDRQSCTLVGQPPVGMPPIRVRWQDPQPPNGGPGQVRNTRSRYLAEMVADFPRFGEPDPLALIPQVLGRTLHGTRAYIHGDLNLENILVGPGGSIWLIDFAQTREGHTLYDFAHLYAEIVAHILSRQAPVLEAYHHRLIAGEFPLLTAVEELARRCLFDTRQESEYRLPFFTACVGALKFENIDSAARQRLYLTAAVWARWLAEN